MKKHLSVLLILISFVARTNMWTQKANFPGVGLLGKIKMRFKKEYIFILFALILAGNKSFSQNYIPVLNDSLYWDIAYRVNDPSPCASYGSPHPYRYALDGDTIFNSITYKKVKRFSIIPFTPSGCPPFNIDTTSQVFDIYLREDTIGKEVYGYDAVSQQETLLYDFSLQQGDSVYLPSFSTQDTYFYADTVYSVVTVDGVTRKYIECYERPMQGTMGGFLIEGIGGARGLFERPYHNFEQGYWIMCVSDINESPIVGGSGNINFFWDCYSFTTSLDEVDSRVEKILFYPNPAQDFIYFNNLQLYSSLMIKNSLGEILFYKNNFNDEKINISGLSPGAYTISLCTGQDVRNFKFVKI